MSPLLVVNNLHVHFDTPQGVVRANDGVSVEVEEGETLGIMGESGCGKTVLFLAMLRLQQPGRIVEGSVQLDGRDITHLPERELETVRGRVIALVPQNQSTALNPAYSVESQLLEALVVREHGGRLASVLRVRRKVDSSAKPEVLSVFRELGFGDERLLQRTLHSYPHQLSGGMRQRVLIAMALLLRPRVLIADEPTTALDRATRVQSLAMLRRLKGSLTMLVVSHDIEALRSVCDRVAVMYAGRVVESGPAREVLERPLHPYSRLLMAAQRRRRGEPLVVTAGETSDLISRTAGCPFNSMCPRVLPVCSMEAPSVCRVGDVSVACHLHKEVIASC